VGRPKPLYWRVAARAGFYFEGCMAQRVTFDAEPPGWL
jgi:hypothetical protein